MEIFRCPDSSQDSLDTFKESVRYLAHFEQPEVDSGQILALGLGDIPFISKLASF